MKTGTLVTTCAAMVLVGIPGGQVHPDKPTTGDDPGAPRAIASEVIENLYRLGPGLFSGGDPQGEAGFDQLRELGVRTIISVDGAAPDVEAARRRGMRYVHLPIGYDGILQDQAARLIKAARTLPGPVFVHCHHGKHRGPAAAALCGMDVEQWTPEDALRWLEQAGTSRDYPGLYGSVADFTAPTPEELTRAGELPEQAEVPGLVEAMIEVDERWERLQAIRDAGFRTPADQPDLDPPHEARLLRELFRESARLPESNDRGEAFLEALSAAEQLSADLEARLRELAADDDEAAPDVSQPAEAVFQGVGQSCKTCHIRFRN